MKLRAFLDKHWLFLSVLVLGACFRVYGLLSNPISLYSDEVDIGYQVYSFINTGRDYQGNFLPLQFHSFSDVRTSLPIYFTALFHVLGIPLDYSIRFSSAVFGVLGILATYLLVRNLFTKKIFDIDLPYAGIFSGLMLALIPWHLTYSRIGFELSALYFFIVFGLFLFTQFLISEKKYILYLSIFFLGLTPMVYSTAKMSVLAYPVVLFLLAWKSKNLFKRKDIVLSLLVLFTPLAILTAGGGIASRFEYISIFTDPTAPTEVNHQRLLDSGPKAGVGSSPSIITKILHNRPLFYAKNFLDNVFSLLSTDFLFVQGDPNLRHSPADSGMLYRTILPLILIGFYFLVRHRQERFIYLILLLMAIPMATSAVTRDGGNHASRSFMLLLPSVFLSGLGLSYLFRHQRIIASIFLGLIFLESFFFAHNYWLHYRYSSERSWSAGMKELIQKTEKYTGRATVISPKNEYPLIFFLYYTRFDPLKFQQFVKSGTVYNPTGGKQNLDGNRIGDTNFYIASLIDYNNKPADFIPGAVYFLTRGEVDTSSIRSVASIKDVIELPSGEPLYYEIHY